MSKIFLQYAWIKEYRGIKDIEINFTDKFTISYDKMKRLTLSAGSSLYIDEFFESNIDINAIVPLYFRYDGAKQCQMIIKYEPYSQYD